MLLRVQHDTLYTYTPAVKTAHHLTHLRPLETTWQRVLQHHLIVTPEPDTQGASVDVFGNGRALFSMQHTHRELSVHADSLVKTTAPPAVTSRATWEAVRDHLRYRAGAAYRPATEFSFTSPLAPRHEAFADYAAPSFVPGRRLLDAAADLMHRLHADFTYDGASTEVNTPALDALRLRRGVCQDFAHIMVACLRSLGLPARYVSGYLLTEPPPGQPRLVGADASHAWASVWVPDDAEPDGAGHWVDFDPTNDRAPGEDYITLAWGRDYGDVSPVRGVIWGGADHTLEVRVTVTPVETADA